MSDFVHLHLHTEHSLLDGINRVDNLPTYVRDTLGQTACAITDHGTVSGTYSFYKSCVSTGIKPILGMEAYYAVQDRTVRAKDHLGRNYHHMVLLATNHTGLHNLYKLSTQAYETGMYHKPRIDDALLGDLSEGLIATSACLGSYSSQLILAGDIQAAEALLHHHAAMFKDRFFIEIQLHTGKEQTLVNQVLVELARKNNWPLLLTNDCHYMHPQDKQLHEESLCMQTSKQRGSVMSDPPYNHEATVDAEGKKVRTRFSFGDIDVHVAHHDWMWQEAQKLGIPYEALSNSTHIADLVDAESYFYDRRNRYPTALGLPAGVPPWEVLESEAKKGLRKRFNGEPPRLYQERLLYELKMIKKMGFYHYMLLVRDILKQARLFGIMTGPGRGSVAGSLVAWALTITEIDPIENGLIFERFLNPGRSAKALILDEKLIKNLKELKHAPNQVVEATAVRTNEATSEGCSNPNHNHGVCEHHNHDTRIPNHGGSHDPLRLHGNLLACLRNGRE